jgi:hypothetical protein
MNNTETAISHKGKQTISGCKDHRCTKLDKRTKKQTDQLKHTNIFALKNQATIQDRNINSVIH